LTWGFEGKGEVLNSKDGVIKYAVMGWETRKNQELISQQRPPRLHQYKDLERYPKEG